MECPFSTRYEVLADVNCQLRGFDDNVEVFSQMISSVERKMGNPWTGDIIWEKTSTLSSKPLN
jgi:hypothetical protein